MFSHHRTFSVAVFVWGVVWGVGTATPITRGIWHQHIKLSIILREVGFSLVFAQLCFFPLTHSPVHTPRRHHWPTLTLLSLHHCLSLSNTAVCLVLCLHLSAPPVVRDVYFIYIFQCSGFSENGSFHTAEPQVDPSRKSLTSTQLHHHHSLSSFTLQSGSHPQLVMLLVLHWFGM